MYTSSIVPDRRPRKRNARAVEPELRFMPRENLRRVIQEFQKKNPTKNSRLICRRSLLELRESYVSPQPNSHKILGSWEMMYNAAIKQAVYAHDWEKLLNILLACPSGGQSDQFYGHNADNYLRAVVLLLLNHRNERNSTEINEYLHLVLSCRSEESQACVLKALLSLPKALPSRSSFKRNFKESSI